MKELLSLNKYFAKYKWRLLLGTFFVILSNIFKVLSPRVVRDAFNLVASTIEGRAIETSIPFLNYFEGDVSSILLAFGGIVLGLAILSGIFMFFMRQTIIVVSRLIEYDLKNDLYEHYQNLDLGFYKRNQTGDLMNRITEDVSKVRMYAGPGLMYSINLTVLVITCIGSMLSVNKMLTLYVLIPLPILSVSIYYVSLLINKRSTVIQEQLSLITSSAQESFSGIRVIKSYVQEGFIHNFFSGEAENYREKSLDLARVQAMFFPLMILLVGISTIITIYVGGKQVQAGTLDAGNIAEFLMYVGMLTWPITSLGWVASIIQRASASQKRINEFLSQKPSVMSNSETKMDIKGAIKFENVSFTYPDTGVEALKNLNFNIEAGQKIAIVGRTGSGKSTIADLLVRMYDSSEGEVSIDGRPISDYNLSDLRGQIGYVPQDVFLFSDTVQNNIAFGVQSAELNQIRTVAKAASIDKEIMELPSTYATVVGERGVTLSGGQKQRIALSRTLLKNTPLLILDDSLSAVDASTEQNILSQLSEISKSKTTLFITHRVFALMDFDKIIVLDNGTIVESGTHEELLIINGIYRELYEKQQEQN